MVYKGWPGEGVQNPPLIINSELVRGDVEEAQHGEEQHGGRVPEPSV